MKGNICRAITFINYHIPLTMPKDTRPDYITLGYFDGMFTERIAINKNGELSELWKYYLKRTATSEGRFSYQNIFCMGLDDWNSCSDVSFWAPDTDETYPLTFVVFLQLQKYMNEEHNAAEQCKDFAKMLKEKLGRDGKGYVYITMDKNDIVVCIKCKTHRKALDVIKNLHNMGVSVVYSYSILSVNAKVLERIEKGGNYDFLYGHENIIDSICFKGIASSYQLRGQLVGSEDRYLELCNKIIKELYDGEEVEKRDACVYDILGEEDFRLIARRVGLGKLLELYKKMAYWGIMKAILDSICILRVWF